MSETRPQDGNKFDKSVNLEDILNTRDDSNIGLFVEGDLSYHDTTKEKKLRSSLFVLTKKFVLKIIAIKIGRKQNRSFTHRVKS